VVQEDLTVALLFMPLLVASAKDTLGAGLELFGCEAVTETGGEGSPPTPFARDGGDGGVGGSFSIRWKERGWRVEGRDSLLMIGRS